MALSYVDDTLFWFVEIYFLCSKKLCFYQGFGTGNFEDGSGSDIFSDYGSVSSPGSRSYTRIYVYVNVFVNVYVLGCSDFES